MRGISSVLASVAAALLLGVGLVQLDANGVPGASLGAAVTAMAIAAFILAYDVLTREERGERPAKTGARSGGQTLVQHMFDPDQPTVFPAATREGGRKLSQAIPNENPDRIVVLQIAVGSSIAYDADTLPDQLNIIKKRTSPESWVYFVAANRNFLCCARINTVLKLIKDDPGVLGLLRNGQAEQLAAEKELIRFTVGHRTRSAEALRQMAENKQTIAMIVDEKTKTPVGPIDWATLAGRVLKTKDAGL
jgi:hypothetical protein